MKGNTDIDSKCILRWVCFSLLSTQKVDANARATGLAKLVNFRLGIELICSHIIIAFKLSALLLRHNNLLSTNEEEIYLE